MSWVVASRRNQHTAKMKLPHSRPTGRWGTAPYIEPNSSPAYPVLQNEYYESCGTTRKTAATAKRNFAMGHDHQETNSSGAVAAIVVAVLLVAILGIVAVAGAGIFWVKTARMESRTAVIAQHRAVEQLRRAGVEAQQAAAQAQHEEAIAQLEQSRVAATPSPRLNFEVTLDREGNASVDGEEIDLDGLRARLAKLKDETSNTISVRINADPECPAKRLIPVLDLCENVGDIDIRVEAASDAE